MIRIKDATPTSTGIFVTAEKFTEDQTDNGLIVYQKGDIKPFQKVFRVGPHVNMVKEGDFIKINFARYTKYKYSQDDLRSDMPVQNDKIVAVPEITINGVKYFHIEQNDAVMIIKEEDYEEVPEENVPKIVTLNNHGLIL